MFEYLRVTWHGNKYWFTGYRLHHSHNNSRLNNQFMSSRNDGPAIIEVIGLPPITKWKFNENHKH